MIVNTVIALIFGIAFVIIPEFVYSLFGIEVNSSLKLMGQFFGGALITVGLLTWSARNASFSKMIKAVALALFIGDVVGFIVALIGQINKVVNGLGWLTVLIYLVLAVWFAVFAFSKVKEPEKAAD